MKCQQLTHIHCSVLTCQIPADLVSLNRGYLSLTLDYISIVPSSRFGLLFEIPEEFTLIVRWYGQNRKLSTQTMIMQALVYIHCVILLVFQLTFLKMFSAAQLSLALSTKELETVWPARSQDNGLGWDIIAYPWGGVSVGQHYKDWPQVGLVQDGSSTYTPTTCSR